MNRDYQKWWSPALGRDMELLVFGDKGTPVLVFPTSMGRFYQWEDFGLVGHMAPRIDAGWLQLWCVDSVDGESFYNKGVEPQDRARRHLAYERYLVEEVLPAIRAANTVDYLIVTGTSFGAFHASGACRARIRKCAPAPPYSTYSSCARLAAHSSRAR